MNFYKKMIKIRKSNNALIYGEYKLILKEDESIYAYIRELNDKKFIIVTNLTNKSARYIYKDELLKYENLLISNYKVSEHHDLNSIDLRPYEARMYKIDLN